MAKLLKSQIDGDGLNETRIRFTKVKEKQK